MSMFPIASLTLSSNGAFLFTNIPQTFTHLQLRIFSRSVGTTSNTLIGSQLNNDYTSGNYSFGSHYLRSDGSSATGSTAQSFLGFGSGPNGAGFGFVSGASSTSNVFASHIVDLLDYTNTNKFKTWRSIGGFDSNGAGNIALSSGYWNQTTAINRINVGNYFDPFTFVAGSRCDLYGISTSNVTGA